MTKTITTPITMPKRLLASADGLSDLDQLRLFEVVNSGVASPHKISSKLVLEAFRAPIKFRRIFVSISGGVLPALLLSCIVDHEVALDKNPSPYFSQLDIQQFKNDWLEETGLSEWEYQLAKRCLVKCGFFKQDGTALRLDTQALWAALGQQVSNEETPA